MPDETEITDPDCPRCRGGGCEWCKNTGRATMPTIAELAAMLNDPTPRKVQIKPDGSIHAVEMPIIHSTDILLTEPSQEQVQAMVDVWRVWSADTPGLRSVNDMMRNAYRAAMEMQHV